MKVDNGIYPATVQDVLASNGALTLTKEPKGINYGVRHERSGLLVRRVKLNAKQAKEIFNELCTLPFPWKSKDGSFLLEKVSRELVKKYSPHLDKLNEHRNIAHVIGAVFLKHGASL
jgi:hypothetical protein